MRQMYLRLFRACLTFIIQAGDINHPSPVKGRIALRQTCKVLSCFYQNPLVMPFAGFYMWP